MINRQCTKLKPRVGQKSFSKRGYYQVGCTNSLWDASLGALQPGKRISKSGKRYYEYRKNRCDMPGQKV